MCGRAYLNGSHLPFTEPMGHVCGCNVCVGCVLRPGSHCASAITGYPERKESMGGGRRGGREGRERRTGLCSPVKWIERWTRKRAGDKKEIASVRAVLKEIC